MKKLLVVWKTDNMIDIEKFVVPYVYNSKVQGWFSEVELLIWGASQNVVATNKDIQALVSNLIKEEVVTYACKMCADGLNATEMLESLGVNVMYTGVYLSDKLKDDRYEVITL